MANICWFEMRVRGTKLNCRSMYSSGINCYNAVICAENGTKDDYMMYIRGETRWSVTSSMVAVDGETLADKAEKYQLELEVCGLSEDEHSEHFHYIGSKCIKANHFDPCIPINVVEDGLCNLSEEDLQKYNKVENENIYVLKDEFAEHFTFDYDKGKAVFDFTMSICNLPGFEDWEEPEDDGGIIVV